MFSFRRKNQKKQTDHGGSPSLRTSPSLPDLSGQGIQWPESLVDVSELPTIRLQTVQSQPAKPANGQYKGSISALYMTGHPPSAFDNRKSTYSRRKPSQKKNRNPATFNIMVAGAQGTGKTSLLRLLLETAEVSPTATQEQKTKLQTFLQGSPKRTDNIQAVSVEICESKFDRIVLSVIDTPGLDFHVGHELTLERQLSSIVKYLDTQFADTLSEETKVVRQSKGDQHVHLCIYTIDPSSIVTAAERRSRSDYPHKPQSERTISYRPSDVSAASADSLSQESYDDTSDDLTMSPADIAVMQRLTKKTNLLPVIARADSLTDEALASIKAVIRRDLAAAGLDFGVFGAPKSQPAPSINGNGTAQPNGTGHSNGNGNGNGQQKDEEDEESEPEERRSRPVIKLRASRNPFKFRFGSRSRSRLDLTEPVDEPSTVEVMDNESVASVRFSAQTIVKAGLDDILPFALIAPEHKPRNRVRQESQISRTVSEDHQSVHTNGDASAMSPTDDGHGPESLISSPTSPRAKHFPFLDGPPADLRGVFTRSYRWGTIDVLAPEHCDFAALRTAVLSTHMKMLKIRTREVLYERYRTEKLLARRATRNISEDETRRMFAEIGL